MHEDCFSCELDSKRLAGVIADEFVDEDKRREVVEIDADHEFEEVHFGLYLVYVEIFGEVILVKLDRIREEVRHELRELVNQQGHDENRMENAFVPVA